MLLKQLVDLRAVLRRMDCASRVHQTPTRSEQGQHRRQQLRLQRQQLLHRGRRHAPTGIGVTGQRPQPRARNIEQDALKETTPLGLLPKEVGRIGCQRMDRTASQASSIGSHSFQATSRAIHGPDLPPIPHQLRQVGCLPAWSSAGIKNPISRLRR